MKIYELSPAYKKEQLKKLWNMPSKLLRGINGERIFITHGSKNGNILNKENYDGLYDIIIHCYQGNKEQTWTGYYFVEINGQTRVFLTVKLTSELEFLFKTNATVQEIKNQFGE